MFEISTVFVNPKNFCCVQEEIVVESFTIFVTLYIVCVQEEIVIESCAVFVNPYEEADEQVGLWRWTGTGTVF